MSHPAVTLLEKAERIAWDCGVDPHLPMAAIVREANEMMGLDAIGTLPEQAESLLLTMGVTILRARTMPIRKLRLQAEAPSLPTEAPAQRQFHWQTLQWNALCR